MPSHTAKERAKKKARANPVRAKRALPAKANKRAVAARKTAFAKRKSPAAKVVARNARRKRKGR